jgi:hypothetical protein
MVTDGATASATVTVTVNQIVAEPEEEELLPSNNALESSEREGQTENEDESEED